jgi:hypothetical protein
MPLPFGAYVNDAYNLMNLLLPKSWSDSLIAPDSKYKANTTYIIAYPIH